MLKFVLPVLAAIVGLPSSAAALEFKCYGVSQYFAHRAERRNSAKEADPIKFINVLVWEDGAGDPHMVVGHVARSGRIFDRAEQYPMNFVERTSHGYRWGGKYDRDPRVSMVGTLRIDRRDVYYTETRLKSGDVVWQTVSRCEMVVE